MREILDSGDTARLAELLAAEPKLATARMEHFCDHRKGASPLGYTAMRRYDTSRGEWRDVTGTGEVARMLLAAGAPVDGEPEEQETPLITAASYGDAEVALVLIQAGADLEARAADDSGGVPERHGASPCRGVRHDGRGGRARRCRRAALRHRGGGGSR